MIFKWYLLKRVGKEVEQLLVLELLPLPVLNLPVDHLMRLTPILFHLSDHLEKFFLLLFTLDFFNGLAELLGFGQERLQWFRLLGDS